MPSHPTISTDFADDRHEQMANALRILAVDAVEKARSGHPGMPLGAADIVTALFSSAMKFDPRFPQWPDRDRFVLSAGHGSMLLYALLYLLGYEDITLSEIRNFRQPGSRTPGHPECNQAHGIETTTGPLGQGLANAVGMALAERHLAAEFGDALVDHHTYALVGDGCLMEGLSQEALTLAGHLRLRKLIVLFDDNGISIDGPVSLTDSTDQLARFRACGWQAQAIDGHDRAAIAMAIENAKSSDQPSLIACRTIIGRGAPNKQGQSAVHGAPLGAEEIAALRENLCWSQEAFEIPCDVRDAWRVVGLKGCRQRTAWKRRLKEAAPELRAAFERRMSGELPDSFAASIEEYKRSLADVRKSLATRQASQDALDVINRVLPETLGGSADLTGSNNTRSQGMTVLSPADYGGRYVHYGIREHAMAAAMNGIALHGGVIPYGGTFLVFSDYCRPAIRLSALMRQRVIYVMTHDSIGLGEDGPTHQPVEQLAALRAIPGLLVMRPCDAVETAECWQIALEARDAPSILALTRQKLPPVRCDFDKRNRCRRGAYEIIGPDSGNKSDIVLFASGSEVQVALEAHEHMTRQGMAVRVVSVPSMELFAVQPEDYRESILGDEACRIAVEAGVDLGWRSFIGSRGVFIGMKSFGASAPQETLYESFGITAQAVTDAAVAILDELAKERRK